MSSSKSDKPRFSKKAVNRAGEVLVDDPTNGEALEILDYWRGLHAEPLDFIQKKWLDNIKKFEKHKIHFNHLTSRLKRSVSIVEKLHRNPQMKLTRMQDIAGLRIVFENAVPDKNALSWLFDNGIQFTFDFESLKKGIHDYVTTPKSSGYRAVHAVIGVQNAIYNELLIEIQVRTRLQHLWAMAVETVGMFYGQALKASQGDQGWLDFFRLASAAFSHVEQAPVVAVHADKGVEQIRRELLREGTENSYFTKLSAIREVAEEYPEKEYEYWLLELNIKQEKNRVFGFKTDQLEAAQELYAFKEKTPACRSGNVQVVLVSTRSFKDLREAYPSYFLDVADFMKTIRQVCDERTV